MFSTYTGDHYDEPPQHFDEVPAPRVDAEALCKWCAEPIYLPGPDCFATLLGDKKCRGIGTWGWHDPEEL